MELIIQTIIIIIIFILLLLKEIKNYFDNENKWYKCLYKKNFNIYTSLIIFIISVCNSIYNYTSNQKDTKNLLNTTSNTDKNTEKIKDTISEIKYKIKHQEKQMNDILDQQDTLIFKSKVLNKKYEKNNTQFKNLLKLNDSLKNEYAKINRLLDKQIDFERKKLLEKESEINSANMFKKEQKNDDTTIIDYTLYISLLSNSHPTTLIKFIGYQFIFSNTKIIQYNVLQDSNRILTVDQSMGYRLSLPKNIISKIAYFVYIKYKDNVLGKEKIYNYFYENDIKSDLFNLMEENKQKQFKEFMKQNNLPFE